MLSKTSAAKHLTLQRQSAPMCPAIPLLSRADRKVGGAKKPSLTPARRRKGEEERDGRSHDRSPPPQNKVPSGGLPRKHMQCSTQSKTAERMVATSICYDNSRGGAVLVLADRQRVEGGGGHRTAGCG